MEEIFGAFAGYIALGLEAIAVIVIALGGAEAAVSLVRRVNYDPQKPLENKKKAWVRFGVWLLIGLEFELGADIVRSAILPTWERLGQLAAIAVIRTFLNYFLEADIEKSAVERQRNDEDGGRAAKITRGDDRATGTRANRQSGEAGTG